VEGVVMTEKSPANYVKIEKGIFSTRSTEKSEIEG
jgi:hypothetical protein